MLAGMLVLDVSASHAVAAAAGQVAPIDKFGITDQERAACTADAIALCSTAYPDEDKLLACMKLNRGSLSGGCRIVFDRGLQRRHL